MNLPNFFSDEKTIYTITDESGERSTITVEKWISDLLQSSLPDVHAWIQEKYDASCKKLPHLSRREKGNAVRERARLEAEKHPSFKAMTDML
jgi:hypothetical protein